MINKLHPLFPKTEPPDDYDLEADRLRLARALIDALSPESRSKLARELSSHTEPAKATNVLAKVIQLLPPGREVSAAELREMVADEGVQAAPKDVYNSIGYLSKTGALKRLGYGRYTVNGMEISTSDDFGGERDRHEDISDDN